MKSTQRSIVSPRVNRAFLAALALLPFAAATSFAQTTQQDTPASVRGTNPASDSAEDRDGVKLEEVSISADAVSYVAQTSVASKLDLSIREVPQSVSVITEQRIKDQVLPTVVDALNQITGVTIRPSRSSANPTLVEARGFNLSVSHDGVPASNSLAYSQFDLAFYSQIEVLRGSAGLLAGGGMEGGLGGNVNLVSKHAGPKPSAYLQAQVGSWNKKRIEADINQPLTDNGAVSTRVVAFSQNQNFFYDRTEQNSNGIHGGITLDTNLFFKDALYLPKISVTGTYQEDDSDAIFDGIPRLSGNNLFQAGGRSYNPAPDWSYYDTTNGELAVTLEQNLFISGSQKWTLKARAAHGEDDFAYHNAFALNFTPDPTNGYNVNYYNYDIRDEQQHDAFDAFVTGKFELLDVGQSVLLGYSASGYKERDFWFSSSGPSGVGYLQQDSVPDFHVGDTDDGKTKVRSYAIYGQTRLSPGWEPLHFLLGARLSNYHNDTRANPSDTSGQEKSETGEITPYAGFTFDIPTTPLTWYASYADIFRPQTGKRYGGGSLDPAIGYNIETGLKAEFYDGRLVTSVAGFRLQQKNKALLVNWTPASGSEYIDDGEDTSQGVEIEAVGKLWKGAEVTFGYTWLDQKIKHYDYSAETGYGSGNNNSSLDRWAATTPEHVFKFWGVQRIELGPERLALFGIGLNWYSGNYDFRATTATTSQRNAHQNSYALLNDVVGYQFTKNFRVNLNINNILDTDYYENFSGWGDRYGTPRSYVLTARYDF